MKQASTIDEVISILEDIITQSKEDKSPLGYFAALYRKVTSKVKEGINDGFFENGPRMEQLDVIFANRYIEALYAYQEKEPVTSSWKKAFELTAKYRPIVLQHLLMGMNAHINLDLGIAAVQVMHDKDIDDLEGDFNKINEILSSLVEEVEQDLANIWRPLRLLLKLAGKIDNYLTDFSMQLARDGAWRFARKLAATPVEDQQTMIIERDEKVTHKARIITHPGILVSLLFGGIRLGERGTVVERIGELEG